MGLAYLPSPVAHAQELPIAEAELVDNCYPVAEKIIDADGAMNDLVYDNVRIDKSSWVALRILPSSHTNPVFVIVGDQPSHLGKRSAEWCLKSVEQCWSQKEKLIDLKEMQQAKIDYEHVRQVYRKVLAEVVGE